MTISVHICVYVSIPVYINIFPYLCRCVHICVYLWTYVKKVVTAVLQCCMPITVLVIPVTDGQKLAEESAWPFHLPKQY